MTMTNETFTQQNAEYSQLKDIEDVKVSIGIQFNELGGYILNLKLFSIKNKFWTIHKQAQSNPNVQIYQGLARPSLMLGLLFIGENLISKDIGVENCS